MSNNTVIGVYDNESDALQAKQALINDGIVETQIRIVTPGDMRDGRTRSDYAGDDQSMGEQFASFFGSLFGTDDKDELGSQYLEAVRRGSTLLIVDAGDDRDIRRAETVMSSNHSIDIDARGQSWRESGWSNFDENAPVYTDEEIRHERESMQAVGTDLPAADTATLTEKQEELKVGVRREPAGKVKVFQRVIEDEVDESVDLENQTASIRRRVVDRPMDSIDEGAFEEAVVEVEQFTEEAVVEKQTRVVGEVDVAAERRARTETVSDTVRRTKVEVEGDANIKDER